MTADRTRPGTPRPPSGPGVPRPVPAGPPPLPPRTASGTPLPRPAAKVPATRDSNRPSSAPSSQPAAQPVRFDGGAEAKPAGAAEPEMPAWARAAGPTLAGWSPSSAAEDAPAPPKPAGPKPEPATRGGGKAGPTLSPGEAMPEPTAAGSSARAAEPAEPRIPEGMVLISEEELARRDQVIADALRLPYLEAASRFAAVLDEIEQRLRDDTVDLAAQLARVLMQRALRIDRTIMLGIAQRALKLLGPVERVVVKCAEADAEYLREHMPQLARAEVGRAVEVLVRPSDDIAPGGLLMTFDAGVIDAREERRLERIAEAVRAAIQEGDDGRALVEVAPPPTAPGAVPGDEDDGGEEMP